MKKISVLGVVAFVLAGTVSATPLITTGPGGGLLNFSNLSVDVTGTLAGGCIEFYNSALPTAGCATPATFNVNSPDDNTIFTLGAQGTIQDIPAPPTTETDFITTVGPAGPVSFDFLGFEPTGTNYCTTSTPGGTLPAACALQGSPFTFTINSASNINVSFTALLCGYTGASGGTNCSNGTLYSGNFRSGFINTFETGTGVMEAVSLANLVNAEPTLGITDSVSVTLSPFATPEPATSVLFGFGLIGCAFFGRRFRRS